MRRLCWGWIGITVFVLLLGGGCYTQLATVDYAPPPRKLETRIDSTTGDTVVVEHRVDTIVTRDRETCVWERDLFGRPRLRCYDTYYPREWFIYNNSPWWYRSDPFWYDYERCPRYYYYDPSCGCCRYYRERSPYHPRSGGSGGQTIPTNTPSRRRPSRSDIVPSTGSATESSSDATLNKTNTGTTQKSSDDTPAVKKRRPSRYGGLHTNEPAAQTPENTDNTKKLEKSTQGGSDTSKEPTIQPEKKNEDADSTSEKKPTIRRRRNPRSW